MQSSDAKGEKRRRKANELKRKVANMTKEQIKAVVLKKKECNAKAMQIVERLIEPNVDEVWLIKNLIHINQSHFQDAVEERAIVKFCGYPLCDSPLKDVPIKQYHISTKQNKVFDITDRKNYCTNVCYRAGTFLKEQLFTSPLWLRDCEDSVEYKLLQSCNKPGGSGMEIDLGNIKPLPKENKNINTIKEEIDDEEEELPKEITITCVKIENDMPLIDFDDVCDETTSSLEPDKAIDVEKSLSGKLEMVKNSIDEELPERGEREHKGEWNKNIENSPVEKVVELNKTEVKEKTLINPRKSKRRTTTSSPNPLEPLIPVGVKIEQNFANWVTVDTLIFLFGEEKVKIMFHEFGSPLNENDFNPSLKDIYIFERYTEICRRLNILELKEKTLEIPTKPLPDYEKLQKEAEQIEIKVKNFLKGDKVIFKKVEEEEESKADDSKEEALLPILPLIDRHGVMAARRRIVLDKVNRTLPDIQSALSLNQFNIRPDVQKFVYTLALTANNIVLKASEWNLAAIVLLKLFSLQNEYLSYAFMSSVTQKRVINLLMAYNLDLTYLERQVHNLTNLEQIIKNSE